MPDDELNVQVYSAGITVKLDLQVKTQGLFLLSFIRVIVNQLSTSMRTNVFIKETVL